MAASQKVNVGAADAQERAGVGRTGIWDDGSHEKMKLRAHGDVNDDTIQGANETIHGPGAGQEMQDEAEGSRGWSTGGATPAGVTGDFDETNSIFTSKQNSYRSSRFIKQGPDDRPDGEQIHIEDTDGAQSAVTLV